MIEGVRRVPGGFRLYIHEDVGSRRWLVLTVRFWPPRVRAQVLDWPKLTVRLRQIAGQMQTSFALAARSFREFGEAMQRVTEAFARQR